MAFLGDGTMSEMTPLTLRAVFVPDESKKRRGLTGARCELPNGLVVEKKGRRTPLYDLAPGLLSRHLAAAL